MEFENQVSMTVHDYEMSDSDCESSPNSILRQFNEFSRNGIVRLDEDHNEYGTVKKSLLRGMGILGKEINVVAIHKNLYTSVTGQAKMEAFRVFSAAVAAKRGGDANIKYAWYGGSRKEICDVVTHGFGRREGVEKSVSHGIGVYLSPANLPIESALRAEADANGVRHMLLCRVILGNTETICAGSQQFQPSSSYFDSGIDNPVSPTKYIIWSAYMNTHIFPNYVISFTVPSSEGSGGTSSFAKKRNPPRMRFAMLMDVLSRFLPPSKMGLILNCYNNYRENKIGRPQLITRLRTLAGDNVLLSVIKSCKDEGL